MRSKPSASLRKEASDDAVKSRSIEKAEEEEEEEGETKEGGSTTSAQKSAAEIPGNASVRDDALSEAGEKMSVKNASPAAIVVKTSVHETSSGAAQGSVGHGENTGTDAPADSGGRPGGVDVNVTVTL